MMVQSLWNWVLSVPVSIWGSIITGIMTLAGVFIGQYAIHRRQEKQAEKKIEALRDALIVELRTVDEWLKQLLYITHDTDKAKESSYGLTEEQQNILFESELKAQLGAYRFTADKQQFSETVFRSNAGTIGELDSETAEAVVQAYKQIQILNQSLQNLRNSMEYEILLNSDVDWETGAGLGFDIFAAKEQITNGVTSAALLQKWALRMLGDTISESDRDVARFAYIHSNVQSKEQKQLQQIAAYMEENNLSSYEEMVNQKESESD